MRVAARTDSNQTEMVEGLRNLGFTVFITSAVGKGFPDIVVGMRHRNFLFEIKDGAKPPSQRKLTEDEEKFFDTWKGQVDKVECLQDCLDVIHRDELCR